MDSIVLSILEELVYNYSEDEIKELKKEVQELHFESDKIRTIINWTIDTAMEIK